MKLLRNRSVGMRQQSTRVLALTPNPYLADLLFQMPGTFVKMNCIDVIESYSFFLLLLSPIFDALHLFCQENHLPASIIRRRS